MAEAVFPLLNAKRGTPIEQALYVGIVWILGAGDATLSPVGLSTRDMLDTTQVAILIHNKALNIAEILVILI